MTKIELLKDYARGWFGNSQQHSIHAQLLKQRVYAIGKPARAKKTALLLSSASPAPYSGAIATYKDMVTFMGLEDAGIITAAGEENGSETKLNEIRAFAKAL